MILLFAEPGYSNSTWCRNLTQGLVAELKLKRLAHRKIFSVDELEEGDFVFVIASSGDWVRAVLQACGRRGIYPILLCNQPFQEISCSCVCSDTDGSMQHLVQMLRSSGRQRIALYGVNPQSVSDACRERSFMEACHTEAQDGNVFFNTGSLACCYDDFHRKAEDYDAVICTNDFAAISLVRNLLAQAPGELERLMVIGCAQASLTDYYRDYIISVRMNYRQFGRAAVALMEDLRRDEYLSHIVMSIRWDFEQLDNLKQTVRPGDEGGEPIRFPEDQDAFYDDGELEEMLRLERLLNECDETDRAVIHYLLRGDSYEKIAEQCYVTVSTVKYRVRKMLSASRTGSRRELVRLVGGYLRPSGKQEQKRITINDNERGKRE